MGRSSFLQNIRLNLLGSGSLIEIPFLDQLSKLGLHAFEGFVPAAFYSTYVFFSCSMTTPNGRFMTQKKICLSMSDCKCS